MKRLTEHNENNEAYAKGLICPSSASDGFKNKFNALIEQLAAYEDSGFEPNALYPIRDNYNENVVELCKASNEGRVFVSPFNIGDVIFVPVKVPNFYRDKQGVKAKLDTTVKQMRVAKIVFGERGLSVVTDMDETFPIESCFKSPDLANAEAKTWSE